MTHHVSKPVLHDGDTQRSVNRRRRPAKRGVRMATFAAIAPIMLMAGCASHSDRHFTVGSVPSSYKTRHPIVLQEQEKVLDIPVGTNSLGLTKPAASAVTGFAQRFKSSAGGAMTMMLPQGSPNAAAARRVGAAITNVLRNKGLSSAQISTVTYHAAEHGSTAPIRLSYGAVSASVEKCGKWKADLTATTENRNYHNFGCASQANLAAIVANPADLLGPRGSTGIDAARRATVIDDYRSGNETNTPDGSFGPIESVFTGE